MTLENERRQVGARGVERRRAAGDLQLEARQIADAERRLGNEASRTAAGEAGEDARRKLAAEQERLADRTERLGDAGKARTFYAAAVALAENADPVRSDIAAARTFVAKAN